MSIIFYSQERKNGGTTCTAWPDHVEIILQIKNCQLVDKLPRDQAFSQLKDHVIQVLSNEEFQRKYNFHPNNHPGTSTDDYIKNHFEHNFKNVVNRRLDQIYGHTPKQYSYYHIITETCSKITNYLFLLLNQEFNQD